MEQNQNNITQLIEISLLANRQSLWDLDQDKTRVATGGTVNESWRSKSRYGQAPTTIRANIYPTSLYFMQSVSVHKVDLVGPGLDGTTCVLKVFHPLDGPGILEIAEQEHLKMWRVWSKVAYATASRVSLMSAEDTALVRIDASAIRQTANKPQYANTQLYGVLLRYYGTSLSKLTQPSHIWSERDVLDVLNAIKLALKPFHENSYVHCDIKADNVVQLRTRDLTNYVLIDYGEIKTIGSKDCPVSLFTIPMPFRTQAGASQTARLSTHDTRFFDDARWSESEDIVITPRLDQLMLLFLCLCLLSGKVYLSTLKTSEVAQILLSVKHAPLKSGLIELLLDGSETCLEDRFVEMRILRWLKAIGVDSTIAGEAGTEVESIIIGANVIAAKGGSAQPGPLIKKCPVVLPPTGATKFIPFSELVELAQALKGKDLGCAKKLLGNDALRAARSVKFLESNKAFNVLGTQGITTSIATELGIFLAQNLPPL